jgi:hypothetical protein
MELGSRESPLLLLVVRLLEMECSAVLAVSGESWLVES